MKMKKGISLIVLVITIIVILILAGAVILSLSQNNPINSAMEANFKSSLNQYQSELDLYISKQYVDTSGNLDINTVDATNSTDIKGIIKSIADADASNFQILNGKLLYIGNNIDQKQWVKDFGISLPFETGGLILWLDGADITNNPQTNTWRDRSGYGKVTTQYNLAFSSTSGSDGAGGVAFDGVDDYFIVNGSFPSTLTIETWTNAKVINSKMLWSFINSNGPDLFFDSARIFLNTGDSYLNPFANSYYPSLNIWHHYIVTFNQAANTGSLYIDGVFVGNATYKNPAGSKLYIARWSNSSGYFWNGTIETLRVYDRVLSDTEILKNYNAGR